MSRLHEGDTAPSIDLPSLSGEQVELPKSGLLHLQFRRYAGCPICNLHLRNVARRIGEIEEFGVREVAVFHSNAETMRPFQGDLPFQVIADPEKRLYRKFGVEASFRALLAPRAWVAVAKGLVADHPSGAMTGEGGHLGLPADFLIDSSGRIVALKYGKHADDQWEVDEILERARFVR